MVTKNMFLILALAIFALGLKVTNSAALEVVTGNNPQPRKENFSKWPDFGEAEDWRYYIIDGNSGNISVNGSTSFDNSTAEITAGKTLHFLQTNDSDFEAEYPDQYNNVFMIGFQGYLPDLQRDIVWNYEMKIGPGVYGTTGFVIERKDTFAPNGTFALPFDFYGITYAGEENYNSGLRCSNVVNWMPVSQVPINNIDPFQWNNYEIRFHFLDTTTVQASISINEIEICQSTLVNYGETEIQIWLDNYKVTLDPSNPLGYTVGFNNKETSQEVLFDNISVKAKPKK